MDHIPCNSHQTAPGALVRDLYFVHHLQLGAVIPQSLPFLLKKKKEGEFDLVIEALKGNLWGFLPFLAPLQTMLTTHLDFFH